MTDPRAQAAAAACAGAWLSPERRAILQVYPHGNRKNALRGVFETRAPVWPNFFALSPCRVLAVQEYVIEIDDIDAFPETPVLDIKP